MSQGKSIWTKESWEEACSGYQDECYAVAAIKRHLMTNNEKAILFNLDLSIEDCLNGRYTAEHAETIQILYRNWNRILGWHEFGF